MKNIFKTGALAVLSLLMITACDPQQSTDYALGAMPTADQLDFTATPTASKANIIDFANTSSVKGIATWDLSGSKAKGETTQATFPFKGEYTITMTLYTSGGSATITKKVVIANDDMSLLNTPMYTSLTGGAANLAGKTWVFDQYYNGHFGIGEAAALTANWWNAKAEEKTDCSLYTQEFTFTQVGVKFGWKNNGYVYSNGAGKTSLADKGYTAFIDRSATAGDFDIAYVPKTNYTFALNETAKTITLSDGAFLGHYAGSSTYQIFSISDDAMYLKCISTLEPGNGWWYRLIPKDKNIKPNIIIPLKEIALNEDFELATPKVVFAKEDMGSLTNAFYSNPAPVPVNTSSKAFLYEKNTGFYSNVFFQATGYKFNLTAQNKITLKVFIPSYNDYTTSNAVAGSWVSNTKLKPQVAVKLQNGSLGGNAYTTQTEIVKTDLATDKWIDLTFDFSGVSTREDYDKIVIQFGAEGQAGAGIFFMDEFHFIK
ncbi:MAG: PKD domain-containing protein [Paludibacter sp.]|nr:PKD domain-containing protein [Paludibacter sp.]